MTRRIIILASFKEAPEKAREMIRLFSESEPSTIIQKDESMVKFDTHMVWMDPVSGFGGAIYYQVRMVLV